MGSLTLGSGKEEFVQIAEAKLKEINEAKARFLKEEL